MDKKQKREYIQFFEEFSQTAIFKKGLGIEYANDPEIISYYACGGNALIFKEQLASNNFMKMVDRLVSNDQISKNYTRSELIHGIIRYFVAEDSEKDAEKLLNHLNKVDKKKWFLFLPVYGFEVDEPITFEKIEFIPKNKVVEKINEVRSSTFEDNFIKRIEKTTKNTMALVTVKSFSKNQAVVIAKNVLRKYLNIFRIFIGSKSGAFNVSVEDTIAFPSHSIIFNDEESTLNSMISGATRPVKLNDPFFSQTKYIEYLLKLEDENSKKSDIQKRLFLGSQLLGEAFLEFDMSTRFLKSMMAIEAMLQVKGEPTKDISLKAAYVLTSDISEAMEVYKNFNMLYDLRSRIAHGEDITLGKFDEYLVMDYASILLTRIIDQDYENFKSLEDYIFERKLR